MKGLMTNKRRNLLVLILTIGVFGIINTGMGVVGIIPMIAETSNVTLHDGQCANEI